VTKGKVQLIAVLFILGMWGASAIVAVFDGKDFVKIVTPIATLGFGWLFGGKVMNGE
jgi:amino acid transporter